MDGLGHIAACLAPGSAGRVPAMPRRSGPAFAGRQDIAEQPALLHEIDARLRGVVLPAKVVAAGQVLIVASGSARFAAAAASGWIARLSGLACETAAPDALPGPVPGTVAVLVPPAGDVAGMLEALAALRARAVPTVALVDAVESPLARGADLAWPVAAGPERGLAATRTITAALFALLRFGVALGAARGALDAGAVRQAERALGEVPVACALAEAAEARFAAVAVEIARAGGALVSGDGWGTALAGMAALQLRQLAGIPAESAPDTLPRPGRPALLLASAATPRARFAAASGAVRDAGGTVIAFAEAACAADLGPLADEMVALPGRGIAQMFAQAVALQLVAYHTALALARDVDRPRSTLPT